MPHYQRKPKSQPGAKVELQFVNAAPNDLDRKSQTRSIIRANAAHFHWRHNRPPQEKVNPHKRSRAAIETPLSLTKVSSGVPDFCAVDGATQTESYVDYYDGDDSNMMSLGSSLASLTGQVGSEDVDPFSTYECAFPRDLVSRCITFSKQQDSCDCRTSNSLKTLE